MVRAFVEVNSKCAGAEFFLVPRELFRNKANETSNPETGVSHVIEGRRRVRKEGEGLGRRGGWGQEDVVTCRPSGVFTQLLNLL